jgi:hypothetical protein
MTNLEALQFVYELADRSTRDARSSQMREAFGKVSTLIEQGSTNCPALADESEHADGT